MKALMDHQEASEDFLIALEIWEEMLEAYRAKGGNQKIIDKYEALMQKFASYFASSEATISLLHEQKEQAYKKGIRKGRRIAESM